MARKKMQLEPGVRYKGYGGVNEYGQLFFDACQKKANPNGMKIIKESESFTLYESKNFLKISCTIEKNTDKFAMIKEFMAAFQGACVELKNYECE